MADSRITELPTILAANIAAASDVVPLVDVSASTTKKATVADIVTAGLSAGGTIAINQGGTGATTAADARTNLGLVIGTHVQAYDVELAALAGVTSAANTVAYFTGSGTADTTSLTAYGRTLIGTASAADARTALGLGTAATATATITNGATLSGTNTGDQTIALTGDVTGSGTGTFNTTLATNAVTATKLADNSSVIVAGVNANGTGAFVGQQWINTNTLRTWVWNGTAWIATAGITSLAFNEDTILGFSSSITDGVATITATMDPQSANLVLAGPTTGSNAAPTFRALVGADLPVAALGLKGAVKPGSTLSITLDGTLNQSTFGTAGTYYRVVTDEYGRVSSGALALTADDIPALDASKITTGTLGTDRIADGAITANKIAITGLGKMVTFGQSFPTPDFLGQVLTSSDGSVYVAAGSGLDYGQYMWTAINRPGEIQLQVRWGGTWNATSGKVVALNSTGAQSGLIVGQSIPAPASGFAGLYLLTVTSGTGSGNAPVESFDVGDWILCDGSQWLKVDIVSGGGGTINASSVLISPSVGSYVTTQDAIADLYNRTRIATDSTLGLVKSSSSILVNGTTGVATVGVIDCGTY